MKNKSQKVLLSFDVEEFDLPKEYGVDISVEDGVKVSAAGLERILKLLEEHKVKATFFITGNFATLAPEMVQEIIKGGHEVACHGVDHFEPCESDVCESKKIIEKIAKVKVSGYRQPRMFPISYQELKRCGYKYDSSVNPAFVPGRYNHLNIPRTPFKKEGIIEIPTSVASLMRVPLFWLALHLFPVSLYARGAKMSLRKTGYFATYFHPWEFSDELAKRKEVPGYIKKNSGKKLVERLSKVILSLQKEEGLEFTTYEDFMEEWGNKNEK